jgi:hypothetical protein
VFSLSPLQTGIGSELLLLGEGKGSGKQDLWTGSSTNNSFVNHSLIQTPS